MSLDADVNAFIYKVETHEKISYFVKLKRGHTHDTGALILELLHNADIKEIIPPVKTIQGQLTQDCEDFTIIVYPFFEGQDGFSRALSESQWVKLGRVLRRIHALKDESPKFVLCHSDIHAGNLLLDGVDTFYIVDWDDPR